MGRHETVFESSPAFEKTKEEFELFETLKVQLGEIGISDEESLISALESETSIKELYDKMLIQEGEIDAYIDMLGVLIKKYSERKQRYDKKKNMIRALILLTLNQTGMKSIPSAYGTASRSLKPRVVEVVDKRLIATEFWDLPEPITPPAVLKMGELTQHTLSIYKEREAKINEAQRPFAAAIAAAKAMGDETERLLALAQIDALLAPAMANIDEELPMPEGVTVPEEEYKLTIRRG